MTLVEFVSVTCLSLNSSSPLAARMRANVNLCLTLIERRNRIFVSCCRDLVCSLTLLAIEINSDES